MADRMKMSISLSVSEDQSIELVKLIECISTSKEGQEALNTVFKEADVWNPGREAVLKELSETERETLVKTNEITMTLKHFCQMIRYVFTDKRLLESQRNALKTKYIEIMALD